MSKNIVSNALKPGGVEIAVRGAIVSYIFLLVILPLFALVHHGSKGGLDFIIKAITDPVAVDALWLTLWTAFVMAIINAFMGFFTAWVLVRYDFFGKTLLSALVDLPFAIPTLIAGVVLVVLLGPQSFFGRFLVENGLPIVFAPLGIIFALMFVTVPFVVRAVEPVLMEQDPAEEEAAKMMGASSTRIFFQVLLPPLIPSLISGTIRSFAKALGEFGSVVIISGNIAHKTMTLPIYVYGEIDSGNTESAASVSIILFATALSLVFIAQKVEKYFANS